MNIKSDDEKIIRRTFSMRREVFEMLERQAKERYMTKSEYLRSLILEKEGKKND